MARSTIGPKVLTTLLILITASVVSAQYDDDDAEEYDEDDYGEVEEPERTCKKYLWNIIQSFLNGALSCLGGKLKLNSIFDIGKRFYCLFKCILIELGVLGEDGRLDEVAALFFFQEAIPEIILDVVIEDAGPCLELASEFRPEQYYCQSYGKFVQCVFNSLVKTLGPYALQCYATPSLGFFFSLINVIVPQATISDTSPEAEEIKKRFREARIKYDKRLHLPGNGTRVRPFNNRTMKVRRA